MKQETQDNIANDEISQGDTEKNLETRKVRPVTVASGFLIILIVYVIIAGIFIYGFGADNPLTQKTASFIPYPAAMVSGSGTITIKELKKDLVSVRNFYEKQDFSNLGLRVEFNTSDGRKRLEVKERRLLNRMIENRIVESEAKKLDIEITSDMISQEVQRKIQEYGNNEDFLNLYGWKLEDFEEKIVKPDMYRERIEAYLLEKDPSYKEASNKINKAKGELDNKKLFEEVASSYSEGLSAKNGGDLGWLINDQIIPEVFQELAKMEKGATSGIIRSSLGYHLVLLEDKKTEDGKDMYKLRQIFIRTKNFSDWIGEKEAETDVWIPLKKFYWDKETASVRFSDKEMERFEQDLIKNSPGDVSVLF